MPRGTPPAGRGARDRKTYPNPPTSTVGRWGPGQLGLAASYVALTGVLCLGARGWAAWWP